MRDFSSWPHHWLTDEVENLNHHISEMRWWKDWIDGHLTHGFNARSDFAPDSYFGKLGFKNTEELFEIFFLPDAFSQIRVYESELKTIRELIMVREMNEKGQE